MGEVTKADLDGLRTEIAEVRELIDGTLYAIAGKKADRYVEAARRARETSIVGCCGESCTYGRLIDAELFTLEDAAARPREEIAALPGVGRVTMRHLDAAMAEHGLTWGATS